MRVSRRFIAVLLVAVCAVLFATVKIHADRNRQLAERVLERARTIRVAKTSFRDVQQQFAGIGDSRLNCALQSCSLQYEFTNSWLSRFRLAPPTLFRVYVAAEGEKVTSVQVGEYIDLQATASTSEGDVGYGPSPPCTPHRRDNGAGVPWRVVVFVTPECTAEQIRRAYAYNLSCLSKLGGCKDARELLPSEW